MKWRMSLTQPTATCSKSSGGLLHTLLMHAVSSRDEACGALAGADAGVPSNSVKMVSNFGRSSHVRAPPTSTTLEDERIVADVPLQLDGPAKASIPVQTGPDSVHMYGAPTSATPEVHDQKLLHAQQPGKADSKRTGGSARLSDIQFGCTTTLTSAFPCIAGLWKRAGKLGACSCISGAASTRKRKSKHV